VFRGDSPCVCALVSSTPSVTLLYLIFDKYGKIPKLKQGGKQNFKGDILAHLKYACIL
jgi:hypothetical protein